MFTTREKVEGAERKSHTKLCCRKKRGKVTNGQRKAKNEKKRRGNTIWRNGAKTG